MAMGPESPTLIAVQGGGGSEADGGDEESDDDGCDGLSSSPLTDDDDDRDDQRHSPRSSRSQRRCRPPHVATYTGGGDGEPADPADPSLVNITSDSDDDSDRPPPPNFKLSDWVGTGLLWKDNLPKPVKYARNRARRVPPEVHAAIIPQSKISVTELLERDIPAAPSQVPKDLEQAKFSHDPVTETTFDSTWRDSVFAAVPFHPVLRRFFNDAWLSGAVSIKFPHVSGCYPLWVENLLFDVQVYITKRTRWEKAAKWLTRTLSHATPNLEERIQACWDTFECLPWDTIVPGLSPAVHLTTEDLALFLSSAWLNDEMINAGADYILQRLGPGSRTRILNCLFIQSLRTAHATGASYCPARPSPVEKAIRAGLVDIVWFPLHVSKNHWTLLKINLLSRTIAYSDSLNGTLPKEELALVQWWLKFFGHSEDFDIIAPDFPSPHQHDSHSCGIIVLSILASLLLDFELWCPERAASERVEWFLRLSSTFADMEDLGELDTDFDRAHTTAPTTPEPSSDDGGFMSSRSSPFPSRPASPGCQNLDDSTLGNAPEPLGLSLDDVDFFLLDAAPGVEDSDVDMSDSEFPDHIPLPPEPTMPVPTMTSDYYQSDKDSDSDYSDAGSDSNESRNLGRRRRRCSTKTEPKAGSSWAHQKRLNTESKERTFLPKSSRLDSFRAKVLADDPKAEFDDTDVRRVRCSHCATWVIMRVLYDIRRWTEHRSTSKCIKSRKTGLSTQSLFSLGFKKQSGGSTIIPSAPRNTLLPCPGLTRESNEGIATYMARVTASGGGAPSRTRIARQLFSSDEIKWRDLNASDRRMVLRRELTLQKWKIGRNVGAVFSSDCLRDVLTPDSHEPQPCSECRKLLKLHTFQVAIRRPMPDESKMKFVPVAHRDPELGKIYLKYHGVRELVEQDDGRSPYLKFAQGCADGTYQSETLAGMVKALVIKQKRVEAGKSLRNMQYDTAFDQFCDLLASISKRAYLTFQKQFGGRGLRSMRQIRAKVPLFRPGISAFNVGRAAEVLKKLNYTGPLALSWDDTALEEAISVHAESKEVCLILGASEGVIRVTEKDDLDALFEEAQLKKADKLRVWVLSIPLPKIPPILIAAVARGSSTKARELVDMHHQLADLLHEYNIHPVSLSSDGAEVERAAQRIIANEAKSCFVYAIPNSKPGCDVVLEIPKLYGQHPTIITQDSKHALKTARNQIMTGARIIVIGFFTVSFSMLRNLAFNILGPLFTRDVEKVDKQDDHAAACLFSAATLGFHFDNHPDQTGLSVYLFVLGELIDAWQNRNIFHRDRVKMVLRARFFLMAWRSHIVAHPDHNLNTHFISRESFDIFLTICDGLLSLIVVYRNFFPAFPLLPWLHSTEACEHLFGMLRQLKKDFNYADVLNFERKLRAFMRGAFGNLSPDEQATEASAGYHHTYFTADDLDILALMEYPTDKELAEASEHAFEEAAQLLKLVGIDAEAMLKQYVDPKTSANEHTAASAAQQRHNPRHPQTLSELLALYQPVRFKSSKDEDVFEACELALAAESLDKSHAIDTLPDSTEESLEEIRSEIKAHLDAVKLPKLRPLAPDSWDCVLPLVVDDKLNGPLLVSERQRHETKATAKAVRQHGRLSTVMANRNNGETAAESGPTLRETLIKRLAATVPASDTFNKTTGIDRYVRHAGTFSGPEPPGAGSKRAENKATVQAVAAAKFVQLRATGLSQFQSIHPNMYSANINELNPLKDGHFVLAMKTGGLPSEIILGEVLTMYSKNTHHDWIPLATSIGTPSYIYIRVYRPFGGALFSSMSCPKLACSTFLQIPCTHILFSLASFSQIQRQDITTANHPLTLVTLCQTSMALFEAFHKERNALQSALKELGKKSKSKKVDDGPLQAPIPSESGESASDPDS
ncbi:hypothetical protein B0H11DRAFT_2304702 [Mycena galericulata]|nr:hypothetical protein B0H11DRAFT_2304702 [Mycena galericulata]